METQVFNILWRFDDGREMTSSGTTGSSHEEFAQSVIARGAVPEGTPWQAIEPDYSLGTQIDRVSEIKARLITIDAESARPMRSIIRQTATEDDYTKLDMLEAEAEALRAELATLV